MMFIIKQFLFLLFISLCKTNVLPSGLLLSFNINSSFEQIVNVNSSEILSENEIIEEKEAFFDNNYSEQIPKESNLTIEEFQFGPEYEVNWTFIDKETVRIIFSLYSLSKFSHKINNKNNLYSNMISISSRSIKSIHSLKYFRFIIRHYKTNTGKILNITQLILKTTIFNKYFSNSLLLIRLNPNEIYSICIYYYQINNSIQIPDLFICQNIIHDHLKHSVHGLLFILTQYSIIFGILIVLQGLFSMRKRRLAHIVHQHLINKKQRIRSTFSSVSLIRQSFSSMDTTNEQQNHIINTHINHEENKLKKRFTSSPAIVLSAPSIPFNNSINNSDESEPFLKLTSVKNHVHFLLGLDEGSDDNQSEDTLNGTTLNPSHIEPYSDRTDALLSMAHILDTNKPWSTHNPHPIPT